MIAHDLFLPEADWLYLLQEIHNRQVIPIVGPELVTVPDPETNSERSLYRVLDIASTIDSLLVKALERCQPGSSVGGR